ncbi:type IV pilin [Halovenus rubra]|uniref:Type IV pilin n=2 Tax=Halovenus rubra TaxID=869890 RepID=A0ABD5WZX9_9EURY|nr:type IV pilin [Halovenus rubra]
MSFSTDNRGVSEGAGVLALVVITVVATASVGMTVTLISDDGPGSNPYNAEFTFDHSKDLQQLLIFYDGGKELRAGSITITGPENEVTWAEIEEIEPGEMVSPSNLPTRLSKENAYGSKVGAQDFIEITYTPPSDGEGSGDGEDSAEPVVLGTWNKPGGGESGGEGEEDGPVEVPES